MSQLFAGLTIKETTGTQGKWLVLRRRWIFYDDVVDNHTLHD